MAVLVLGFALALLVAGRRRLAAALAVWAGVALVLALLTAGTYAEMITKYPHAGGAAAATARSNP